MCQIESGCFDANSMTCSFVLGLVLQVTEASSFGSSLTLSNAVTGTLRIRLASGRAMLIAHPFPDKAFPDRAFPDSGI